MLLTISTNSATSPTEPGAASTSATDRTSLRGLAPDTALRLAALVGKPVNAAETTTHAFGTATVFFPEASDERCTIALAVAADPDRLASLLRGSHRTLIGDFVSDDADASPVLLATAIEAVFGAARRPPPGVAAASRPALPLEISVPALRCGSAARLAWRRLRGRGWKVDARPLPLDDEWPAWGHGERIRLRLTGTAPIADALRELCRALWTVAGEAAEGRPASEYGDEGLRRLVELDEQRPHVVADRAVEGAAHHGSADSPDGADRWSPLRRQRIDAVMTAVEELGARSVIDLGCGSGDLLVALVARSRLSKIVGLDVSAASLRRAGARIGRPVRHRRSTASASGRVELIQGAVTYVDRRLEGFDAAVLMEVVEHIDPARLPDVEQAVFGVARPRSVVVTTPDADYNVNYGEFDGLRHPDHRFEWSGAAFTAWCDRVGARHGYTFERRPVGAPGRNGSSPTQLAVFVRVG